MSEHDLAKSLLIDGRVTAEHTDVELARLAWAAAETAWEPSTPYPLAEYARRVHHSLVTLVQLVEAGHNAADELREEIASARLVEQPTILMRRVLAVIQSELPPIDPADREAVEVVWGLLYPAMLGGATDAGVDDLAAILDGQEAA